jgi:two-component system NtrC family sensor kinase
MTRFRIKCGTSTCRYALFGIVFGICFPIVAISFDVIIHLSLKLDWSAVILVHKLNPIHYIIDTAPLFLGIAFGVAGYFQERARKLNKSLMKQTNTLEYANANLKKALNDFHEARDLLVKSEKLASLGQLTAGIAHELKNPLNFITNFSESGIEIIEELQTTDNVEEKNEVAGILRGNFKIINEHGKRANNILQSMMTFARSGNVEKRLSDINLVCKDAADIAFHGMSSTIIGFKCDFKKELAEELPKIIIMYEDISRVILNLLTNAFYAVNERRQKENDSYHPQVILTTTLERASNSSKENILITVKDNGTGIPETIIEKIFNPFFTTKPSGEGTGLGLSISHDIIMVHGGEMKVSSKTNEITEFLISLPVNITEPKIEIY